MSPFNTGADVTRSSEQVQVPTDGAALPATSVSERDKLAGTAFCPLPPLICRLFF